MSERIGGSMDLGMKKDRAQSGEGSRRSVQWKGVHSHQAPGTNDRDSPTHYLGHAPPQLTETWCEWPPDRSGHGRWFA